jgi:hypothetical protein
MLAGHDVQKIAAEKRVANKFIEDAEREIAAKRRAKQLKIMEIVEMDARAKRAKPEKIAIDPNHSAVACAEPPKLERVECALDEKIAPTSTSPTKPTNRCVKSPFVESPRAIDNTNSMS